MYAGNKVCLRALESSDVEAEHSWLSSYETVRGLTAGLPLPPTYHDAQEYIGRQSRYTRGEYQFGIETLDGELVGRCGVIELDAKNRLAEIAIVIGPAGRGQGYGTEAIGLLCCFCFREMNLHKLKVTVYAFNRAAIRCYEKNGFVTEGVLQEEYWRDGAWRDVCIMSRLCTPADLAQDGVNG